MFVGQETKASVYFTGSETKIIFFLNREDVHWNWDGLQNGLGRILLFWGIFFFFWGGFTNSGEVEYLRLTHICKTIQIKNCK